MRCLRLRVSDEDARVTHTELYQGNMFYKRVLCLKEVFLLVYVALGWELVVDPTPSRINKSINDSKQIVSNGNKQLILMWSYSMLASYYRPLIGASHGQCHSSPTWSSCRALAHQQNVRNTLF